MLQGKTAYADGKRITGTIQSQTGVSITPSTSAQVACPANRYTTGSITVVGSTNLVSSNIRSGINIFGVTGNLSGQVIATVNIRNSTGDFVKVYYTGSGTSGVTTYNIQNGNTFAMNCVWKSFFCCKSSSYSIYPTSLVGCTQAEGAINPNLGFWVYTTQTTASFTITR